jgi:hypothetical protein
MPQRNWLITGVFLFVSPKFPWEESVGRWHGRGCTYLGR